MRKFFNCKLICLVILSVMAKAAVSQTTDSWNEKSARKWIKSGEWKKGLKPDVAPSVDAVEFAKQYHLNKDVWDKAFAFMRNTNLDTIAPGKYPIDGTNAFATITYAADKDFEKTGWESHRKYIDLQYIISGKEKIGEADVATATVTKPYNEAGDGANYTAEGTYYIATPKEFFLFFPQNAHRPSIKVDGYDKVKKLVIKIKVAS